MPPVLVAQARWPALSSATAPTVSCPVPVGRNKVLGHKYEVECETYRVFFRLELGLGVYSVHGHFKPEVPGFFSAGLWLRNAMPDCPAVLFELLPLLPARFCHEPVLCGRLHPALCSQAGGAGPHQQTVVGLLQNGAGHLDRVPHPAHRRHRPGLQLRPLHHQRVHLNLARRRQHRAAPCVERGVILQRNNGGSNGVQR